ncbi:MAG: tetratricopeptide repeat protein [Pirellulales bacterium]|nr:tetratricopeptide repeat protein [Pirellulales bacterium]
MQDNSASREKRGKGRLRRVANLRLLGITLIVIAMIVPVSYAWHAYQVYRTSTALLEQADALEQEEKWDEAAFYLDRYLQIVPDDMPTHIRLAEDYDKSAMDPVRELHAKKVHEIREIEARKLRAIERYQIVLGNLDDSYVDDKLRMKHRVVTLLLETLPPEYVEAGIQADELLEVDKEDPVAWRAKALSLYHHYRNGTLSNDMKSVGSVLEAFERAVALNPSDAKLSRVLAVIYREGSKELLPENISENERKKKADETIDALVEASPESAESYLVRYQYRVTYNQDGAAEDMQRALELGPEDFKIRVAAGAFAQIEARRLRAAKKLSEAEAKYQEAARHYEHAIEIDPQSEEGYVRLGSLYQEQSQIDQAISTWKLGLTRTSENSIGLNAILADLLLESGQHEQAGKALDRLDLAFRSVRHMVRTPQLRNLEASRNFLRGRWCVAQGQPEEAISLLRQVTIVPGSLPKEIARTVEAWLIMARVLGSQGKWEEAAEAYEKALELQPQYILAHKEAITAWTAAGKPERAAEVQKKLERLHTSNSSDPRLIVALAELALQRGDYKDLEKWEIKLKKAEGDSGQTWKYYRARRLVVQAKNIRDPLFKKAVELAAKLQAKSPKRTATFILAGLIAERKGETEDAIDAYQRAMELGDRSLFSYQKLVRLLIGTGQVEEAQKLLARIESKVLLSDSLTEAQMVIYSQQGKSDLVRDVARKAIEARPNDYRPHQRMGRLLESQKKFSEAEIAYKKAVKLSPDNLTVLGELFRFYVASKQKEKAEQILTSIAANDKIDEVQRTLAVAECRRVLGDSKAAEAAYRKAAKLAAENPVVQGHLVRYLLSQTKREKWEEAKEILERLAKKNPDSAPTQRALARVKASMGLAKDRNEAVKILEALTKDPDQTIDIDYRYLAGLYESQGDIESARREYLKLVDRDDASSRDIAYYVNFLLRKNAAKEAGIWLDRLEKKNPDDAGTAALRVRWLHAQGRDGEIEKYVEKMTERLLDKAGDNKTKQSLVFLAVGNLYATVGKYSAAEKYFRKLPDDSPNKIGVLANSIAKQGRRLEAVKLCIEDAKKNKTVNSALALSTILLVAQPSKEELALADPILSSALETHKENETLLANMATLRVIQGQTDKAVELYRKVLEKQPQDVMSINNLATLLGENPKTRTNALEMIDRAIEINGSQPNILDTKATILLYEGKLAEAVKLLEKATSTTDADPRYFFHLALAHQKSGSMKKAKEAYEKAEERGLKDNIMTVKDHDMLNQLKKDINKK